MAILFLFLGKRTSWGNDTQSCEVINLKNSVIDIKQKDSKEDTVRVMDQAIEHLSDYLNIGEGQYTE